LDRTNQHPCNVGNPIIEAAAAAAVEQQMRVLLVAQSLMNTYHVPF
jgi:hypothetical protein